MSTLAEKESREEKAFQLRLVTDLRTRLEKARMATDQRFQYGLLTGLNIVGGQVQGFGFESSLTLAPVGFDVCVFMMVGGKLSTKFLELKVSADQRHGGGIPFTPNQANLFLSHDTQFKSLTQHILWCYKDARKNSIEQYRVLTTVEAREVWQGEIKVKANYNFSSTAVFKDSLLSWTEMLDSIERFLILPAGISNVDSTSLAGGR